MPLHEADPIWGEMPAKVEHWADNGRSVDCARSGGRYNIVGSALPMLKALSPAERARLTTWIVDQRLATDEEPPVITTEVMRNARAMPALSVAHQMDRLLAYLARSNIRPGAAIVWMGSHTQTPATIEAKQTALAWLGAESESEISGFRQLLEGSGYLHSDGGGFRITAKGYARMDELRRGVIPTRQAFIAMWFGTEMLSAYENAIAPAVIESGFTPLRIDRKEHLNKIDDQIVAEIRRSRFVVADFTCGTVEDRGARIAIARGGVYFEAGLAQGLGIPVIWCVRQDQINDVHFDTRQFNHIAWTHSDDLKIRLTNRIRANIVDLN